MGGVRFSRHLVLSCSACAARIQRLRLPGLIYLFYARLIGLTAGTLVYLFLIALILGHRRPRLFERLLFFVSLSLFLIYAGGLLEVNARIHYPRIPDATQWFYQGLTVLGISFLLPLVWNAHYAYRRQIRGSRPTVFARPLLVVLYLLAACQLAMGLSFFVGNSLDVVTRLTFVMGALVDMGRGGLVGVALLGTVCALQDWRAAKDSTERGLFR